MVKQKKGSRRNAMMVAVAKNMVGATVNDVLTAFVLRGKTTMDKAVKVWNRCARTGLVHVVDGRIGG